MAEKAEQPIARVGDVQKAAAAILRMQAHTLDSQGRLMIEMSEKLREEADRVEHGGELPDLHVIEEPETDVVLPTIRRMGPNTYEATGAAPRTAAQLAAMKSFLGEFHDRWLMSPNFVHVFNAHGAGEKPSSELAVQLVRHVQEMDEREEQS